MAVFFWITIWQFASMYLGQEILLASPVSVVRKLFELSFTGNFWQSVGFSFVRIVTGFLLAMFLGIFLAVLAYWSKTVEILIAPVIAVVKSTPVASFIILCLIWIPSEICQFLFLFLWFCLIFSLHAGFHLGCAGKQEWQQRLSEYPQVLLVRNCIMQKYI